MDVGKLREVLRADSDIYRIVEFLVSRPEETRQECYKKEIFEGANISHPTLNKKIGGLVEAGILSEAHEVANARFYRANRDHPFVRFVESIYRQACEENSKCAANKPI